MKRNDLQHFANDQISDLVLKLRRPETALLITSRARPMDLKNDRQQLRHEEHRRKARPRDYSELKQKEDRRANACNGLFRSNGATVRPNHSISAPKMTKVMYL